MFLKNIAKCLTLWQAGLGSIYSVLVLNHVTVPILTGAWCVLLTTIYSGLSSPSSGSSEAHLSSPSPYMLKNCKVATSTNPQQDQCTGTYSVLVFLSCQTLLTSLETETPALLRDFTT